MRLCRRDLDDIADGVRACHGEACGACGEVCPHVPRLLRPSARLVTTSSPRPASGYVPARSQCAKPGTGQSLDSAKLGADVRRIEGVLWESHQCCSKF